MASDDSSHNPIKGAVIPESIRRISGRKGNPDGLIEIGLVGHRHRYRVRIDLDSATPRLMELHLVPSEDATEINPATVRQVPVRRLARAAARFIGLTEHQFGNAGDFEEPTDPIRPDHVPGGRKLDVVHYREVVHLLTKAQEWGLPPRPRARRRPARRLTADGGSLDQGSQAARISPPRLEH